MTRFLRVWLAVTLLVSSACSMALEIVAGRLLAPYVGMSLYTWTAIIAVVLGGLTLGHWIGGFLADWARRGTMVAVALILAAGSSYVSIDILRGVAPNVLAGFDPVSAIGVMAMAAFFLPSLFAGLLSPVLTAMALEGAARPGAVLGRMFALGALGAIGGTLAAGFWMISWLGSSLSVALIAGVYAVLAVPFLSRAAGIGVAVAGAVLMALAQPGGPCTVESDYYCIRVDPVPVPGRTARVLALDHLAHGVNDRDAPTLIHAPYVHLIDELALRRVPDLNAAFFVGGGAYTLPRAWAARHPEATLVVAEVDPAVTDVAAAQMWLDPATLSVRHLDARQALAAEPGPFDVIFGDAFHDISIPQHLVTDEFHALVAAKLAPGGFYALNVVEAMREPLFLLSLVQTLQTRFAVVELWLDTAELSPTEKRTTWVVIASDRDSGIGELRARQGTPRTWVRVPVEAMLRVLPSEQLVFLSDDYAPVDRLMRHILLNPALAE